MLIERVDPVVVEPKRTVDRIIKQINTLANEAILRWAGDWDTLIHYVPGDVVTDGTTKWLALTKNDGVTPIEGTDWTEIAGSSSGGVGSGDALIEANTTSPSGNVLVVTGLTETLLPGCDLTIAAASFVVLSWDIWVSQNIPGQLKAYILRIRRTNIAGAVLASKSFGDVGDSALGHQQEWMGQFIDAAVTDGEYVVTIQATAGTGGVQTYSDTRTFWVTGK